MWLNRAEGRILIRHKNDNLPNNVSFSIICADGADALFNCYSDEIKMRLDIDCDERDGLLEELQGSRL
jgi:hypothetical protein